MWATASENMSSGWVRYLVIRVEVTQSPLDATAIMADAFAELVRSDALRRLSPPRRYGRGCAGPMTRREPRPPPERETTAARVDAWRVRSRRLG